ncbi:uncharacterized protein LOC102706867 isoform X2 [Oryza brachyantha]|uniref:Uncharacterized protein n=1 Tax=Oryza brachyantha TaxID=4533 RepID=J3MSG3_ORYBR|nr:uncharacterized protein LOC102706867 isoform X2 [Oryza brachyantha]
MEKKADHCMIDIPTLAQELRVELSSLKSPAEWVAGGSVQPWIFVDKVGESTRSLDPHEYVPQFVSIGPYHRTGDLAREANKVNYLGDVLSAAAADSSAPMKLEDYLSELAHLEHSARRSYVHSFDIPSGEFVRMLLLDACYILVRFGDVLGRRPAPPQPDMANGVVPAGHRVVPTEERRAPSADQRENVAVVRDVLYLAENQIPFFVVDKVYELAFLDGKTRAVDAIARYVHDLLRWTGYTVATPTVVAPPALRPQPANLLHLVHMHFTPTVLTSGKRSRGGRPVGRWRTATEYYFAGVRFKRRALSTDGGGGARSILDVKASRGGGTLQVPRLSIDDQTWRLLRNLMALEQSNPEAAGTHVTAYCVFMSQLACTARDVELLSRRGVIVHGLGNDEQVAELFANLCKGAVFDFDEADQNYLRPVCQTLERRFRSRPRRWMAWLKQKYFLNPWLAAGLVAATIGLACSVIQAVYSVLGYIKPGN